MNAPSLRWLAYARWQLLDYLWQRLLLPLALAALLATGMLYSVSAQSSKPGFWTSPDGVRYALLVFRQVMGAFIPLAVLMAMNGVVAHDRQKGHFRFLFAKPVPVTGFYVSAFVVHLVAVAAAAGLLAAVFGEYSAPQQVLGIALACALTFVLLGSLLFLFSVLTYQDGIVFILLWVATLLARQLEPAMRPGHWLHTAVRVLPPTHRLDAVRDALYAARPVPMNDLWHVLAYGGVCFALAVVALRKLSLAR